MTAHAVAALSARFGDEVPPVLWTPPDPRREHPTALVPTVAELDDDEVAALAVLSAPQVRIEGRVSGALEAKLCIARSGAITARVQRTAGTAVVDQPFCNGTPSALAAAVSSFLGSAEPADPSVCASFPADAGLDALRAGDAGQSAAQLRALGVEAEAARKIAKAFDTSRRSAEFTLYSGNERCASVVAVIDSSVGRIVAYTVLHVGAGAWTSISEGSAHRIGKALARACEELPGGGWTP